MGRIRRAIVRLRCGVCLAEPHDPCTHRTTGKPIEGFHVGRRIEGRNEVLNREVRKIEGDEEEAEFWQWSWVFLGLAEKNYPEKASPESWRVLYKKYPEIDPSNQYWGTF